MDSKKLAKLLYPDAKPITYWEEKYAPRFLPETAEVTRFAPSPTGPLHIGHFFQCICNSFIAKSTNGIFYFRVEDTDKKREVPGAVDKIVETLATFGIVYDEGRLLNGEEKGDYGPYLQSERMDIYNSFARYLVAKGRAFPCFCSKAEDLEEIEERREEQLEKYDELTDIDEQCRYLTLEEVEEKLAKGEPYALKFLSTGHPDKVFKFKDCVKGERKIRQNTKDFVLIKSNGLPVYAFAHAVDDHLMKTTLVVRGEEWYSSLAAHLELFDAFGFERVKYAHNPVICKLDENGNKRKLSKRKDPESDMRYFLKAGYPPAAITEYLLTLANSNFEQWRLENPTLSINEFPFSAEKITQSNPMFDFAKLNDISKNYISRLPADVVYQETLKWAKKYSKDFYAILIANPTFAPVVFGIDRDIPKPRKDISRWADVEKVWGYMFSDVFANKFKTLNDYEIRDLPKQDIYDIIMRYCAEFSVEHDKTQWFDNIKKFAEELGYATDNKAYKANPTAYKGNVATACEYIRIAITGSRNSPDLFSICATLGEAETKFRALKLAGILEKTGEILPCQATKDNSNKNIYKVDRIKENINLVKSEKIED